MFSLNGQIGQAIKTNGLGALDGHSQCSCNPDSQAYCSISYASPMKSVPFYPASNGHFYSNFGAPLDVSNCSLNGEAYFNVHHQPSLPINVQGGHPAYHTPNSQPALNAQELNNKDTNCLDRPANSELRFCKLKCFKTLAVSISNILKSEQMPPDSSKLTPEERDILSAFINKRYRLKESQRVPRGSDLSNCKLADLPRYLEKYNYGKRKEENMKLVFNWVFKFLKNQIAASCQEKPSKDELDYLFYTYYFRQAAEQNGLNIISFYKPNFVRIVKNSEKTFNANFVKNVQLSDHFIADFMLALDDYMLAEYKAVLDKKLFAIFVKWETKLEWDDYSSQSLASLARSIAGSQKCKLPWTLTEIQLAIACVKSELGTL